MVRTPTPTRPRTQIDPEAELRRLAFDRPHVLRNDKEYQIATAIIDALLDRDPRPKSREHEILEFLSVLVEAYEDHAEPRIPDASPQAVVDFALEQRGMSRADLAAWLGGRSRVSEFYSGERRLSLTQVATLRARLGIPADLLIVDVAI